MLLWTFKINCTFNNQKVKSQGAAQPPIELVLIHLNYEAKIVFKTLQTGVKTRETKTKLRLRSVSLELTEPQSFASLMWLINSFWCTISTDCSCCALDHKKQRVWLKRHLNLNKKLNKARAERSQPGAEPVKLQYKLPALDTFVPTVYFLSPFSPGQDAAGWALTV